MIRTELYDGQGLGNQLWVYAAGRSIAEQLGVNFNLSGIERFKGKGFLEIDEFSGTDQNSLSNSTDVVYEKFLEKLYYDTDLKYISSSFDDAVCNIKKNVKLDGLFQSEKYFFGELDRPERYIRLKKEYINEISIPSDVCVINLRGGEYKRHGKLILPISYWENAIRNMQSEMGISRFKVVTDDFHYARALFPKYSIISGNVGDCYSALYNAKYLILSNSSFSYFPVKTSGEKKFVIAPMYWSRFNNPLKRWASPANLYRSWIWQDEIGNLHDYEKCLIDANATEHFYETNLNLRTTQNQITEKKFRTYIPISMRKSLKNILGKIFPKNFG